MTRDTPSVMLSNSELRDMSLAPSAVLPATVTISHPQLRDLILPLKRGHVLYPCRSAVYEQRWTSPEDPTTGMDDGKVRQSTAQELFKLSFTPTCITTNGAIFACGGQKGELFLTDLPQEGPFRRTPPVKPFELNARLPSGWINNAIAILPTWPNGWAERQAQEQRAHAGYRKSDEEEAEDTENSEDEDGSDDSDMDVVDDDDDDDYDLVDYDEYQSPAVATYPNSMPFGHAPRIPVRGSSSSGRSGPQYVTSRRGSIQSRSTCSSHRRSRMEMPRILVSNNDKTVKMFSLRPTSELPRPSSEWEPPATSAAPALSAMRQTQSGTPGVDRFHPATTERVPPPRALFGSSFGYDSIGLNEGILQQNAESSNMTTSGTSAASTELSLRRTRYLGESQTAYRARNPIGESEEQARVHRNMQFRQERAAEIQRRDGLRMNGSEPRKLSLIGGTRFDAPVNHASLSPDLRTMVTVGDSTDVYLYEVIDGGRRFRKIGVYNAATDWSFSTSWSKDGRKFAVASQDGQVTVWDHRTSRPLALFYSRPSKDSPNMHDDSPTHLQQDEVTSSSGREAARVVKFSPEGSSRDLLVFSEESTNIHVIDARTFETHVVIPVPKDAPGAQAPPTRRSGVDSSHVGISGVAFDPTGDWLYAGTERTVVEWDLRRYGGGEGGTWSMA